MIPWLRARPAAIVLLLVTAAVSVPWSARRLERARAQHSSGAQILYLPSGRYLKVASLGFPELLADIVYIWSIQYYGNYDRAERFGYLEHIYGGVISELDPRYVDPYLVGSMIMGMEAGDYEMALRLLDKGIAANPKEWILSFEAGFVSFNSLGDHARAARYFEMALAVPGAPPVIRRLHAEMFNKMGDKRTSLEHWRQVYEHAENDYVRDVSWMHVHDLTIEVDLQDLRGAVQAYRERAGAPPPDLQALVRAGLVNGEPVDPDGQPYRYDRATGEVSSASRFRLRRKAGA